MTRLSLFCYVVALAWAAGPLQAQPIDPIPSEPLEIGNETQFVFDNWSIDNHWTAKWGQDGVVKVFHQPVKYESNPVIPEGGFLCPVYDEEAQLFRMWYAKWTKTTDTADAVEEAGQKVRLSHAIAYAESRDGIAWTLPNLGLIEFGGTKENNVVWQGPTGYRASSPQILQVKPGDEADQKYLMLYRTTGATKAQNGISIIGSNDGIHWDPESNTRIIDIGSDTFNNVVYDPRREEYVCFLRPKHIYEHGNDRLKDGAGRRVARLSSPDLWHEWTGRPQTILVPDSRDMKEENRFYYGLPTRYAHGAYWSCLWLYNLETVQPEMIWSRDGFHFERLPERTPLIPPGPEGSWDDGMIFAGPYWVEVGDEWWFYYTGWDGPHNTLERTAGIGLTRVRKEGLVSLHGPKHGGVVATRLLKWPGGKLRLNANASEGKLQVRVLGPDREEIPGFTWEACEPFTGDAVDHIVKWNDHSIEDLEGHELRLEFLLQDADLFAFQALSER